jgi:ABC-type glycerol-3-phosphate transport system permease component
MNSMKTGAVSGCIVWVLLIGFLGSCILPIFFCIGSVTSFSDYAIQTTGKVLCPAETTPESYSYETTTTDDNGFSQPATAYELHCVAANGEVLKTDPIVYAFLWDGIFALVGIIIIIVLSFVLAAPAGALIAKFSNRNKAQ